MEYIKIPNQSGKESQIVKTNQIIAVTPIYDNYSKTEGSIIVLDSNNFQVRTSLFPEEVLVLLENLHRCG